MSKPEPLQDHQSRALVALSEVQDLLVEYGTGTGKTRIYIELVDILTKIGDVPILVLVPNSLMEQTLGQFEHWLGERWTEKHLRVLGPPRNIERRRDAL